MLDKTNCFFLGFSLPLQLMTCKNNICSIKEKTTPIKNCPTYSFLQRIALSFVDIEKE